jgi:hypothetical protein
MRGSNGGKWLRVLHGKNLANFSRLRHARFNQCEWRAIWHGGAPTPLDICYATALN